ALAIQQQPAHIDGAPMPSLATTNRFQQIDQKSLQTFMALSDLGLGHVRDYHGSKRVSILNVVIVGVYQGILIYGSFKAIHRTAGVKRADAAIGAHHEIGRLAKQIAAAAIAPVIVGDQAEVGQDFEIAIE